MLPLTPRTYFALPLPELLIFVFTTRPQEALRGRLFVYRLLRTESSLIQSFLCI